MAIHHPVAHPAEEGQALQSYQVLMALLGDGRESEAALLFQTLIAKHPDYPLVACVTAERLIRDRRPDKAVQHLYPLRRFLPKFAKLYWVLAGAFQMLGRMEAAEAALRDAIRLEPGLAEPHYNLAMLLYGLKRYTEAERSYRDALRASPSYAPAHNNLGSLLFELGRVNEAEAAFAEAIRLEPQGVGALNNLAELYLRGQRPQQAEVQFERVLILDPGHGNALAKLFHLRRSLCAWRQSEQDLNLVQRILEHPSKTAPFVMLNTELDPQQQLRLARACAESEYGLIDLVPFAVDPACHSGHRHLRIAYLSADFHEHATMHLLAGVLEAHDRDRFDVFLYSYGPDVQDNARIRALAACHSFRDLRSLTDRDAAQQILSDEIDILIDLKGYTQDNCLGIVALRPAPVVVSWLGYPGTLGHPGLADYIIGDPVVTPLANTDQFSERIAQLPYCYQPNDAHRVIDPLPTRESVGLPGQGFVFCCFNQSYKFNPAMFNLWCRLLGAVQGSVLWLLQPGPLAMDNLRWEAAQRGIDPQRLVFAPWLQPAQHLGRLQLADLALDTFPVVSHTTASDALWAGVPLVTKLGDNFVSRVAASVLRAAGLPELVTSGDEEYFKMALDLATNPGTLAALKAKLRARRNEAPLFDTARFTIDIERLYGKIWEAATTGSTGSIVLEQEDRSDSHAQMKTTPINTFHRISNTEAVWITIDDGPNPETTPLLLALLKRYQVKAAFFVRGDKVASYPELAAQIVAEGHRLLSHGYSHRNFEDLSALAIVDELERTEALLAVLRPTPSPYPLRLPFGKGVDSAEVGKAVAGWRNDVVFLQWSHSPGEWSFVGDCQTPADVERLCDKAVEGLAAENWGGGIFLLHDWPVAIDNEMPRTCLLRPYLSAVLLEKVLLTANDKNLAFVAD